MGSGTALLPVLDTQQHTQPLRSGAARCTATTATTAGSGHRCRKAQTYAVLGDTACMHRACSCCASCTASGPVRCLLGLPALPHCPTALHRLSLPAGGECSQMLSPHPNIPYIMAHVQEETISCRRTRTWRDQRAAPSNLRVIHRICSSQASVLRKCAVRRVCVQV